MQKQFVTYEIALKLKELGFDEDCINFYSFYSGIGWSLSLLGVTNEDVVEQMVCHHNIKGIKAPLYQQVTDWFREKHNIQIEILWRGDMDTFNYKIGTFQYGTYIFSDKDWKFEEYYEAREQAILKVIEIINQNNNGTN